MLVVVHSWPTSDDDCGAVGGASDAPAPRSQVPPSGHRPEAATPPRTGCGPSTVAVMRSLTPRQWTGITLVIGALTALTVAVWPLFVFLRGLLPSELPVWRGLAVASLVVIVAGAANLIRPLRPISFRLWSLILTAWVVAIGAVAGMVVLIWLVLGTPGLDLPTALSPKALDAIGTRAFAVVAGLGGVALLVIHYRRQRTTEADAVRAEAANVRAELAAEREVAKLFTDTFDSASSKLGDEHAAVRLAGVHALARLADEAPQGREDLVQMVIDVLCAYLRMPYTPRPDTPSRRATLSPGLSGHAVDLDHLRGNETEALREKQQAAEDERQARIMEFESFQRVRHTIIRIIGVRLRKSTRWRGKDFDFTGVVFDGGDLTGACFTGGEVSFERAEFIGGGVFFDGAQFTGGNTSFYGARFAGRETSFVESCFAGGVIDFRKVEFTDGVVLFNGAVFSGGEVRFDEARFTGGEVAFLGAAFSGAEVSFCETSFLGGSAFFVSAQFSGGEVLFHDANFSSGMVCFNMARFTGGSISFYAARFSGGSVHFRTTRFVGGEIRFVCASFMEGHLSFEGSEFLGGSMSFSLLAFCGGSISFRESRFSGGKVSFHGGGFTGGYLHFNDARFNVGALNFEKVNFIGGQVDFGWGGFAGDLGDFAAARGTCPTGLREAREQAAPGVLLFPASWGHRSEQQGAEISITDSLTGGGQGR